MATAYFESKPLIEVYNKIKTQKPLSSSDFKNLKTNEVLELK
jgi:hypothetical protein